jgi:hypothetical protein
MRWRPWSHRLSTLAIGLLAAACTSAVSTPSASNDWVFPMTVTEISAGDFLNLNGWVWYYTTAGDVRFADIASDLARLREEGIRVIGIYSPYHGNREKWLGCAPFDFYDVAPQSGTLDDFKAMVSVAHSHEMKVVTYFVNIYIDHESDFFRTAEEQYAAGDRTSREVSAFKWSDDPAAELPIPAAGPSEWQYSEVAGTHYWSLWGEAGFDHTLPGAQAELRRVQEFWLDAGVDGFMWDAAFVDPAFQELMIELPLSYTPNDKWLTFESTSAAEADPYYEFGLTSWFNYADDDQANDYSRIVRGAIDADGLEEALSFSDEARVAGRLTHAWSPWGPPTYPDNDRMLPQEAALLAGAGVAYGSPNSVNLAAWPEQARADWHRVLAMIDQNPALLPSASRMRLPTGEDPKVYAMMRRAVDVSQTALLVYNFAEDAAIVPVDLRGTGISTGQVPIDIFSGHDMPPMTETTYQLDLPGYGFAVLEVDSR